MNQKGKVSFNGVALRPHELNTIAFLVEKGYNIDVIPKSNIKGVHSPDLLIDGVKWEMKAPRGSGKSLMKNTLQKASRQSLYVIVDLRRTKRYQRKCLVELKKEFGFSKLKYLKIITKSRQIIDIKNNYVII